MKGRNPYKIEGPALISFSGGRTSGYMLKKIIDAYEGQLPEDVYVVFANTGKEMPQTLDFVNECSEKWNCKIHWLELEIAEERPIYRTKEVTYETASRNGEPFAELIKKRQMIPNTFTRFCTQDLKINVMKRFIKNKGFKEWTMIVGLRHDEPMRVAKQNKQNDLDTNPWDSVMPLYQDKITKKDVHNFWEKNNFDLELPVINGQTVAGNCDLCFLKGSKIKMMLIKEKPELVDWWIEQEEKNLLVAEKRLGKKLESHEKPFTQFSKQLSYVELVEKSKQNERQIDLFPDDSISCFCHD
jgi:3'-phosphoadenosine 5'-phosphosulfate sulfotransferase (PAPS reductase)/FAD synthetase